VDKGYERGNLRFVTKRENRNNQRSVRDLQQRLADAEARLRSLERRATESVHGGDGPWLFACA
jgi:hypothetical protein